MAKAQTTDVTPEEVVVDAPVTVEAVAEEVAPEEVVAEEIAPVLLNQPVPEKESSGYGSRDFNSSL